MGGLGYCEVPDSGFAFEYPDWLALDETDPARIVIDTGDPEESSGIVIAKVYDLKRGDDPDTQATRIFKAAAPFAERALAYSGLSVKRRLGEEPVNTEAPPYHYEYYAEGRFGSDPITLRIKLVQGHGAVWCFAAWHPDPEMVEPGSNYGIALDSIMSTEY